jgi:hypothetical protein
LEAPKLNRILTILLLALAGSYLEPTCLADSFQIQGGNLDLTVVTNEVTNAVVEFDIRGGVQVGIYDPSNNLTGGVLITDGTAFGGAPPAVPNTLLLTTDLGHTQAAFIQFADFQLGGPGALLQGNVLTPFPISDPTLALFTTLGPFSFGFDFVGQQQFAPGELVTELSLVNVASIPEPGTTLTEAFALGLLIAADSIRRRRTPNQL